MQHHRLKENVSVSVQRRQGQLKLNRAVDEEEQRFIQEQRQWTADDESEFRQMYHGTPEEVEEDDVTEWGRLEDVPPGPGSDTIASFQYWAADDDYEIQVIYWPIRETYTGHDSTPIMLDAQTLVPKDPHHNVLSLERSFKFEEERLVFAQRCIIASMRECQLEAAAKFMDDDEISAYRARSFGRPQRRRHDMIDADDDDEDEAEREDLQPLYMCPEREVHPELWQEVVETLSRLKRFQDTARLWAGGEETNDMLRRTCWRPDFADDLLMERVCEFESPEAYEDVQARYGMSDMDEDENAQLMLAGFAGVSLHDDVMMEGQE